MERMFMQNFGGQTKSIMVFLKVAYSLLAQSQKAIFFGGGGGGGDI